MKTENVKKSLFAIFLNLKNYILQFSIANSKRGGFTRLCKKAPLLSCESKKGGMNGRTSLDEVLQSRTKAGLSGFGAVSPPHRKPRDLSRGGFTLVEVIVAMTILSISLVMVMQLFSGGLKSSKTSCDYTRAVLHAKEKMEELFLNPVHDSGKFDDGFEWDSSVEPSQIVNLDYEDSGINLLNIKVNIAWFDTSQRKKSIELISLKTVLESENE